MTEGETFKSLSKPSSMRGGPKNNWYTKSKAVFATLSPSDVVNVKYNGAVGDGVTDDLAAIQALIFKYAGTGKMRAFRCAFGF